MSGALRQRAKRTLGGWLAVGMLAAGVSACSTDLTVFGGNQSPLTGFIVLHGSTVRSGHVLHAELVLHNSSDHPILLWRGCSFQFVQLVLTKGSLTTGAFWAAPLCRPGVAFVAHRGTTIYHFKRRTAYGVCIMVGHRRPAGIPQCLRGNREPTLPPGTYTVTVVAGSARLEHELTAVRSAQVRVVR